MTQQEAQAAFERTVKDQKIAKNSLAYKTALEAIENPNEFIVCGKHSGSGRFSKSESWGYRVALFFDLAGIKYERINDAPKGGRTGDKIKAIINGKTENL